MKKIFLSVLLTLVASVAAIAQQTYVQGSPRAIKSLPTRSDPAVVNSEVDFEAIQYWVGEGSKKAALVMKWGDGKGGDTNLVWGYLFNSATGEQMLRDIAAADPRFYMLAFGETQYGAAIGGMGFDLNNDGNIALVNGGQRVDPVDGVCGTSEYDFDDWTAADPTDHWAAGWYNGYWSYWTTDNPQKFPFEYSQVGATGRILVDGCVDGWSFMADMTDWYSSDMTGPLEYVTNPAAEPKVDYTNGVFILNEDWYGHQNSTINFLTSEGEWVYRAVQKENEGVKLGCTAQYGTIYGDRLYIMSKQDKDPGDVIQGGRLNIFDAKTLKMIRQYPSLGQDKNGIELDGRGFLGVSENKAYVGTNNGIRVFNLQTLEFTGNVSGSENDEESGYGNLYNGQVGTMARVDDRVFAVHQRNGLLVINPETDRIEQTITGPEGELFSSVVVGNDGNLWLSVGTNAAENRLGKLDPHTLSLELIDLPEGTYGPANSWYAWTPDGFCASRQQNVLYWNGGANSWFSNSMIFRYDIDTNTCTLFIDHSTDPDGWKQYGCSFRVDPRTDEIYTSLFKNFGDPTYVLRKYSPEGDMVAEYPMIEDYWFPSLPIFPDVEEPVADAFADVALAQTEHTIALSDAATDADNFNACIVKTVASIAPQGIVEAVITDGNLIITPITNGEADIEVQFNSNGKTTTATLHVSVENGTGIASLQQDAATEAVYDLSGRRITSLQKGQITIQRAADGTIRKVITK